MSPSSKRFLFALVFPLLAATAHAQAVTGRHPAEEGAALPAAAAADNAPQGDVQKVREWLVAYLIAHQGYRVDQMGELEKRLDAMPASQIQTLVDLYQQKHEMALQREQANMQMRQQMLTLNQQQRAEQVAQQNRYIQEQDAGANQEQQRLDEQQQQVLQGYQQRQADTQPYGYLYGGGYGYGAGLFGGGAYYDRYWH